MGRLARRRLVWTLWFVTWAGLLAGLFEARWYRAVVLFSIAHAGLFLVLTGFRVAAFPNQVRIAYVVWVALGTYLPGGVLLLWITTVGLATNLFWGYCPLARMLYLLPWNREAPLTASLVARVFTTPPVEGRFTPRPESPRVESPASI
jgi:hypothetical protein